MIQVGRLFFELLNKLFPSFQLISSSSSNYNLLTFFILLLVLINNHQIFGNSLTSRSDYQYHNPIYNDLSYEDMDDSESPLLVDADNFYRPDNDEIRSPNAWSQLFHRYSDRSTYPSRHYSPAQSAFALRRGEIRYIPYPAQKRAIPIEFQKALFAHGIVGRRR